MKDSMLAGAAETAAVQSKDHCPSGRTSGPKKSDGLKFEEVSLSNKDRNPSTKGPQFSHNIGGK